MSMLRQSEMLPRRKCRRRRCFAKAKCFPTGNADDVDASPKRNASPQEMPTTSMLRQSEMLPHRKCRRRRCFAKAKCFPVGNAGMSRCGLRDHAVRGCRLLTINIACLLCLVVRALLLQTDLIGGKDIAFAFNCFDLVPVKTRHHITWTSIQSLHSYIRYRLIGGCCRISYPPRG